MHRRTFGAVVALLVTAGAGYAADQVQLAGGDIITGEILSESQQTIVFQHPDLGRLELSRPTVAALFHDVDMPAQPATEESDHTSARSRDVASARPRTAMAVLQDEPVKEWTSRLELGGSASTGNSETQSFFSKFTANRENDRTRTLFDAAFFYGGQNNMTTETKFTTGLRNDWLQNDSPWFYFAEGRYDFDDFQDWDHRVSLGGGFGYEAIRNDEHTVLLRGGLGAVKEFGSMDDDIKPEAILGADWNWTISDLQSLTANTSIYPDLEETGEFRSLSEAAWRMKLDNAENIAISVGLRHEYQSLVAPGTKEHDIKLTGGLVIDF